MNKFAKIKHTPSAQLAIVSEEEEGQSGRVKETTDALIPILYSLSLVHYNRASER